MKRKIILSLLITTMAFSMLGCSNGNKKAQNTESAKTTEITTDTEDAETIKTDKATVSKMEIVLNDEKITLPISYTDFIGMGYNCSSAEYDNDTFGNCVLAEKVSAAVTDTTDYISFTNNAISGLVPILYNDSDDEKSINDCNIIGFQFNQSVVPQAIGITMDDTEDTTSNGVITNDGVITFTLDGKTITTGTSTEDDVKSFLGDKEYIDNSECAFIPTYDSNNIFIGFKYFHK